jgi:hypothetical protein
VPFIVQLIVGQISLNSLYPGTECSLLLTIMVPLPTLLARGALTVKPLPIRRMERLKSLLTCYSFCHVASSLEVLLRGLQSQTSIIFMVDTTQSYIQCHYFIENIREIYPCLIIASISTHLDMLALLAAILILAESLSSWYSWRGYLVVNLDLVCTDLLTLGKLLLLVSQGDLATIGCINKNMFPEKFNSPHKQQYKSLRNSLNLAQYH